MPKSTIKKNTTYIADVKDSSYPVSYEGQAYDVMLHAWLWKWTSWLSPASMSLSIIDWASHLAISPARQIDLSNQALKMYTKIWMLLFSNLGVISCSEELECVQPKKNDKRFSDPSWEIFPFNFFSNTFLMYQDWWNSATMNIRGVSKHHEQVINFTMRQILDTFSPSNNPFTNPEIIETTFKTGGSNFVHGFNNFIADFYRSHNNLPPIGVEKYQVGKDVAITPGKVIYRNHLIELIQYSPRHSKVYPEPILIVPAWIMKYYILDLSPHNSLVKYLVNHGHTVFIISWKNPDSEDRDLGLDDYLNLGVMQSINIINNVVPQQKIHTVGYCLGGTLLTIAAASLAATGEEPLKTMSLFATQVDFRESSELSLFIDQSQISYLEDVMWEKGYLDGSQMSWAFSMLRSNDLIWSKMIHTYLLGKRPPINDLMAWDFDTTRLPYRMHSEYLHKLFLNNDLVQGHYKIGKKHISLADIQLPIFSVGTVKDHVSPWKSAYKIQLYTNSDVTFVLTNGGHNTGIVNQPTQRHPNRGYQIKTHLRNDKYINAETWRETVPFIKGSWWPEWQKWLVNLSGEKIPAPPMGIAKSAKGEPAILYDAPGTYVLKK